jgi:hypothetical protein
VNKSHDDVWSLIEDLSDGELETLGGLISGLNQVEMVDGAPRYDSEEMDLIGRFQDIPDSEEEITEDAVQEESVTDPVGTNQGDETATTDDTGANV